MTETQGLIAGMLLFFALYLYIFWPEKVNEIRICDANQGTEPPTDQKRAIQKKAQKRL
jgi:hypothetical protein